MGGIVASTLATALAFAAVLHGQFRSGVNLVEVYASVVDRNGQPITGLAARDFTVLEDGQPQRIETFTEGEFPLAIAVAIDRSFSMRRQLPAARDAARTLIGDLRPADQAAVIAVGSDIETVAPLGTDRGAELAALNRLAPWGTTGLYDAIIAAIGVMQPAPGRRALVLLSDGSDRYSQATAEAALDRARRSDVLVYPVAFGQTRPPLFARLAELTGGRSFQPRDPGELNAAMHEVSGELRHQYLLGYAPARPDDGAAAWRSISVRVDRPGAAVRARRGYVSARTGPGT